MITEQQARVTLGYLIAQFRERNLYEVAADLESAAAARLAEEVPRGDLDLFDETRKSVFVTRAPRPGEAFREALTVLRTRLIELPATASRLTTILERPAEEIVFRPDAGQGDISAEDTSFSVADFSISEAERAALERALDHITSTIDAL